MQLGVLAARLADEDDTGLWVDADGASAVAAGGLGDDLDAGLGQLGLDRLFVARADLHRGADRGEHARPADQDGLEHRPARTEHDDLVDQLGHGVIGELVAVDLGVAARVGQHHVRQPGDAGAAVEQREPDAGAEAERDQRVARRAGDRQLTHADHRVRHETPRRSSS